MAKKKMGMGLRLLGIGAVAAAIVGVFKLVEATNPVKLYAILPNGTYAQGNVNYLQTDNESFATIVPQGTTPISIQGFDLTPTGLITGNVFTWNVALTGYNYIIVGLPKTAGKYQIWTIVKFADGSVIRSNILNLTVT